MDVVAHAVPRQVEIVDGINDIRCIEPGVLVMRAVVVYRKRDRFRRADRKIGPGAVFKRKELAAVGGVGLRIVVLDKRAGPSHQIEPHQFPPVVGILTFFKGRQRTYLGLVAADELRFSDFPNIPFRPDSQVLFLWDEKTKLAGKVQVGLIVRRGGKKNALTLVRINVFLDGAVALAFAVAQVVAFIDEHQAIAPEVREFPGDLADGEHLRAKPVLHPVVFPHFDEVLGTDNQSFESVVVFEDAGQGGCHQCLAKTHHIADENPAPFIEMVRGDLYRSGLELKELMAEIAGNAELREPGACFLGEVIRHLEIDMVGRRRHLSGPAFFDNLDKLVGYVQTPLILPAVFKPLR